MDVPLRPAAYLRVLKLASTPSWEEFSRIAAVAGAGIVLVGLIGFLIFLLMSAIPAGGSATAPATGGI